LDLIEDAKLKKAEIKTPIIIKGNLIYPLLITNATSDMRIVSEEQFGPVLPVVKFNDIDDVINEINNSKYGLQISVYTNDLNSFNKISNSIQTGAINLNSYPQRGPDILPFTSRKFSGIGFQGVKYSLQEVITYKNIVISK